MKKKIAFIMTLAICFGLTFTACSKGSKDNVAKVTPTVAATESTGESQENLEHETIGQETTDQKTIGQETIGQETTDQETIKKENINIAALKGPTAIGMAKIMQDGKEGTAANNYNFTIAGAADEISAGLLSGDIHIAAVPCNLASVLFNKTNGGIKVAGINTLGVLYIVETGDQIKSVADLKGKTIYSTGKGTTPEFTLNYLLKAAGIDPSNDVSIEYKSEATEVAAILSESENAIAMLPQPYVTTVMMQNDKLRIALDVTKEWEELSDNGSSVVTGVVVVKSDFLEENKTAVDAFLEEYETSVAFVNENLEEASDIVESFDIVKAAVAKKAIPYCNITLIEGEEMKEKISGYLNVLHEQAPNSVGGNLPTDEFYYMR